MRNETRQKFNEYVKQVATLNGVANTTDKFAVVPSVQQTLESKIQDTSAFLSSINVIGVTEQEGEKIGIGVSTPIASRTDTSDGVTERKPRDVKQLSNQKYRCEQTNYDTSIRYATIDAWAKLPNFQAKLRDAIIQKQALDRLMVGWNGTSVAPNTNLTTNPLLQDVNKGWIQKVREADAKRVISAGATAGKVKIGATGGDYKNLDALVYDVVNSLIEPWYRDHPELKVVIGRQINTDFTVPQIDEFRNPMDREALARLINQSKIGGVPAVQVPYMLDKAIVVTIPRNLSIYYQTGARRRFITDEPKLDRIVNWESSNDAYVVEDYGCIAVVENIEFV